MTLLALSTSSAVAKAVYVPAAAAAGWAGTAHAMHVVTDPAHLLAPGLTHP